MSEKETDVRALIKKLFDGSTEKDRPAEAADHFVRHLETQLRGEPIGLRFPMARASDGHGLTELIARRWAAIAGQAPGVAADPQMVDRLLEAVAFILGPTKGTAAEIAKELEVQHSTVPWAGPPTGRLDVADAVLRRHFNDFGEKAVRDLEREAKKWPPLQ